MSSNENKLFVNKNIIIQGVDLAKTITDVFKCDVVLKGAKENNIFTCL